MIVFKYKGDAIRSQKKGGWMTSLILYYGKGGFKMKKYSDKYMCFAFGCILYIFID